MAWVRLHLKSDGSIVFANTENITFVGKGYSNQEEDFSCVSFAGSEDNCIAVTETVEEVMAKIRDAIGEY